MTKHFVLRTGLTSAEKKAALKLPKMNNATLKAKLAQKDARLVVFPNNDKATKAREKIAKSNMEVFEKIYKTSHPHLVSAIKKMPDETEALLTDSKGKKVKIPLRDKHTVVRSLILGRNIAHATDIHKVILQDLKQQIEVALKGKDDIQKNYKNLKLHKLSSAATPAKFMAGINELLAFWGDNRLRILVQEAFAGMYCAYEEGIGRNTNTLEDSTGDMTESGNRMRKTDWNPIGIFNNLSFPLKRHITCVRNQGTRGTCEVFALTAAVETLVSVTYDKKVNLSEQALQKTLKLDFFPSLFEYKDGGVAFINLLGVVLNRYIFAFERDWDYNPSYSRIKHDSDQPSPNNTFPPFYTNSAVGYQGLACSDTNHQAAKVCHEIENKVLIEVVTTVEVWVENLAAIVDAAFSFLTGQENGHWVKKTVTNWIDDIETSILCEYKTDVLGTSGYKLGGFMPFYVLIQDWNRALQQAKFYLDNCIPVLLEIMVLPSFINDELGYITNVEQISISNAQSSNGFHAILIVGYCDNSNLPANAPSGAGGGYFIVKNSWGTLGGDCGFYYVPYQYVDNWGTAMTAITSVVR